MYKLFIRKRLYRSKMIKTTANIYIYIYIYIDIKKKNVVDESRARVVTKLRTLLRTTVTNPKNTSDTRDVVGSFRNDGRASYIIRKCP